MGIRIRRGFPVCKINLQLATMYIGILDTALGTILGVILSIHVYQQYDPVYVEKKLKVSVSPLHLLPVGILITMLVFALIQFAMGFVVFIGAAKPSRPMCNLWMAVAAISSLWSAFVVRIPEMIIVYKFIQQLKEYEKRSASHLSWEPQYSQEPPLEPQNLAFIIPQPANGGGA